MIYMIYVNICVFETKLGIALQGMVRSSIMPGTKSSCGLVQTIKLIQDDTSDAGGNPVYKSSSKRYRLQDAAVFILLCTISRMYVSNTLRRRKFLKQQGASSMSLEGGSSMIPINIQ